MYEEKSMAHKIFLRWWLYTLKMKDYALFQEHLSWFSLVISQLVVVKVVINNEEAKSYITSVDF